MNLIYLLLLVIAKVEAEVIQAQPGKSRPQRILAGPSHFSFPPNCSKDAKPKDMPFCATGELDLGLKWVVNFDTYFFDAFDPTKTVLFGLNATINKGIPESLELRTGGCAVPYVVDLLPQLKPHLVEAGAKICTSGGGPGKYDPKTKSYSAEFKISGEVAIYSFGKRTPWPGLPFNAVGKAWLNPHFDIGFDATVIYSSKGSTEYKITLAFPNTMTTVNGSILTWHILERMSFDMWTAKYGHRYTNRTFVDKIIQLQPPQ
ncbi:hypothetical protein Pmar_PMAR003637 [Perkinsus marinus ATCC 50983]|uniref:Uncharacterized protein n=1 Tax=Perkinsus marinus (strain ATCC 50983 / TXsc) TaxID=423536 RepID=C5KHW2_PERM5|nr:hypothetical protein Pmar_PMAR003637 [Perkinsus marinus ATCC 50983]EER16174.1 hypothetical protein Pmar_PMAR003637 [Perkinsus marinus ATCC 50983]|eukprot:XP_002784378.1 hypothetical protein Pmar_PMAR003637 [Perkinsus marinus ATCC 50983]